MNRHSAVSGRSDGGAKRGRILEAAVRVFAEKGFYNAKVSDIARVALTRLTSRCPSGKSTRRI